MDEKICARRAQEVHREVTGAVVAFDAEAFSTVGQKRTEAARRPWQIGGKGYGKRLKAVRLRIWVCGKLLIPGWAPAGKGKPALLLDLRPMGCGKPVKIAAAIPQSEQGPVFPRASGKDGTATELARLVVLSIPKWTFQDLRDN